MAGHRGVGRATLIRKRRRAVAIVDAGKRRPWWVRWFRGDAWWLVGFLLGFGTGALLLWAGFLLWLTGSLTDTVRSLFGG